MTNSKIRAATIEVPTPKSSKGSNIRERILLAEAGVEGGSAILCTWRWKEQAESPLLAQFVGDSAADGSAVTGVESEPVVKVGVFSPARRRSVASTR